jgi:molecular chaperone GrpE
MEERHMKEDILEHSTNSLSELQDKADELKDIAQDVRYLLVAVSQLRQDFNLQAQSDESSERLINKLNEELQRYHNDVYPPALRAILIDLITLYDDLSICIENIISLAVEIPGSVLQMLITFQESITRILQRNDVNPFVLEEELFLASRQRALRIITTGDIDKHNCIARRARMGFECQGKLLRPELVDIYKYVAPLTQEE